MESKPIYFRPSEKDLEVLSLIAKQHPVFSDSPTELLRIALQAYWYEHAPDAGRSKTARLKSVEETLVEHGNALERVEKALAELRWIVDPPFSSTGFRVEVKP